MIWRCYISYETEQGSIGHNLSLRQAAKGWKSVRKHRQAGSGFACIGAAGVHCRRHLRCSNSVIQRFPWPKSDYWNALWGLEPGRPLDWFCVWRNFRHVRNTYSLRAFVPQYWISKRFLFCCDRYSRRRTGRRHSQSGCCRPVWGSRFLHRSLLGYFQALCLRSVAECGGLRFAPLGIPQLVKFTVWVSVATSDERQRGSVR